MPNLTLAIDDSLLLEARRLALDRRTSVNQLVRDYLATLVSEQHARQSARSRLKSALARSVVEVGPESLKRQDLYER